MTPDNPTEPVALPVGELTLNRGQLEYLSQIGPDEGSTDGARISVKAIRSMATELLACRRHPTDRAGVIVTDEEVNRAVKAYLNTKTPHIRVAIRAALVAALAQPATSGGGK